MQLILNVSFDVIIHIEFGINVFGNVPGNIPNRTTCSLCQSSMQETNHTIFLVAHECHRPSTQKSVLSTQVVHSPHLLSRRFNNNPCTRPAAAPFQDLLRTHQSCISRIVLNNACKVAIYTGEVIFQYTCMNHQFILLSSQNIWQHIR